MEIVNLFEFIQNPVAESLMWRLDPRTGDGVGKCKECEAELRLPNPVPEEMRPVPFEHENECPWMREVDEKTESRIHESVERLLAAVLVDEPEVDSVLSALTVVAAAVCDAAATESGSSVDRVVGRFTVEMRRVLEKVTEAMSRVKEDRAA